MDKTRSFFEQGGELLADILYMTLQEKVADADPSMELGCKFHHHTEGAPCLTCMTTGGQVEMRTKKEIAAMASRI